MLRDSQVHAPDYKNVNADDSDWRPGPARDKVVTKTKGAADERDALSCCYSGRMQRVLGGNTLRLEEFIGLRRCGSLMARKPSSAGDKLLRLP